jgi:hypothetical protein
LFFNLREKSIIQSFGEEEEVDVVGVIGEVVRDLKVVGFGPFSFAFNSILNSICIPSSVEILCECCFCYSEQLASVAFERGCKISVIEERVFANCVSLRWICIPATVNTLDKSCFEHCTSLGSFVFESGSQLFTIGDRSFGDCESLTSICIPVSVDEIGNAIFDNCKAFREVTFEPGSKYLARHDNLFEAGKSTNFRQMYLER